MIKLSLCLKYILHFITLKADCCVKLMGIRTLFVASDPQLSRMLTGGMPDQRFADPIAPTFRRNDQPADFDKILRSQPERRKQMNPASNGMIVFRYINEVGRRFEDLQQLGSGFVDRRPAVAKMAGQIVNRSEIIGSGWSDCDHQDFVFDGNRAR